MNKIENENLINTVIDARNGVDGAFEKLYKDTVKFSYSVAYVLLKNEEDIEDVLQNSYMYVAKSIGDLKKPESFESWLATIVRHECQKYIVKHKKVSDVFANVLGSKELEFVLSEDVPYELIERKEINEAVRKIVDHLSDDKRVCVVLYYFEQKTISEIAEIIGIPEGTVKSRLHNARKELEKEFKKFQKKENNLYGLSVIPLLMAFFTYQCKNIVIPVSIAEGASACVAISEAASAASVLSSSVGVSGGTAAATGASVAGTAVATKVTAVAVAAAVITGGVATVNYIENKKEKETVEFLQTSVTEEYTTSAVSEKTIPEITETSTEHTTKSISGTSGKPETIKENLTFVEKSEDTETKLLEASRETTQKNTTTKRDATTKPVTTVPQITQKETTTKKPTTTQGATTTQRATTTQKTTTEKKTTQPTTMKETTTMVPVTEESDIYSVSGGVLKEYAGEGGKVSVPSSVDGDKITAIGMGAFSDNSDVISVSLPSTVTRIGQEAFSDCTNLKSISLPSSLQTIGIGAFYSCTMLTSVNIPSGVTSIGDDAFAECLSLSSINIPSSVTSIGDNAFDGCDNLIIKCPEGSVAHNYAVENSLDYELI